MSRSNPPLGEPSLERDVAQMRHLLVGLCDAVKALQAHLGRGEARALEDSEPLIRELRGLVRLALDTEARFETERKKTRRDSDVPQLALATARDQIGRRLDRLRAAEDADGVS